MNRDDFGTVVLGRSAKRLIHTQALAHGQVFPTLVFAGQERILQPDMKPLHRRLHALRGFRGLSALAKLDGIFGSESRRVACLKVAFYGGAALSALAKTARVGLLQAGVGSDSTAT